MISFYGGNGSLAECRLLARNPLKSCPAAIGAAHQPRAWPVVGGFATVSLCPRNASPLCSRLALR